MNKEDKRKINKLKKKVKKQFLPVVILIGLAVIIIAVSLVAFWQLYGLKTETKLVSVIAKIVPLPAASVNGEYVYYEDYLKTLNAAKHFYAKQKEAGFDATPPEEDIMKMVLEDRLIKNKLVRQIAFDYKITVTQDEVDSMVNEIIASQGTQEEFEEFLNEFYLMSLADYKKYFLIPGIYYDKLNQRIIGDDNLNSQPKKDIQAYMNRLRNGESFDDLLKEGSDNILTRDIVRGDLTNSAEDILFDLPVGQHTDILTLPDSFQIIRVNSLDSEKGIINISSLVVPITTLDDIIEQRKQESNIKIYIY